MSLAFERALTGGCSICASFYHIVFVSEWEQKLCFFFIPNTS